MNAPSLPTPPTVGDLWVDVALPQLHILARPFPQGQPPPMPLVSGAFPQEVTSALATHGVVPVTSVAYEQALDGHLGGSMKLHILASLPTQRVSQQVIANRWQLNNCHQSWFYICCSKGYCFA